MRADEERYLKGIKKLIYKRNRAIIVGISQICCGIYAILLIVFYWRQVPTGEYYLFLLWMFVSIFFNFEAYDSFKYVKRYQKGIDFYAMELLNTPADKIECVESG